MLLSGIDHLLRNPSPYLNKRWGLVTNDAARYRDTVSRQMLLKAGMDIQLLFSPEHGILTIGDDGAQQADGIDPVTGIPVISLYGKRWAPEAEEISDLDAILFDIPDIGCRFYTYLWTLTYVMEACAAAGKPMYVMDRPNPIGTILDKAEGPWLDELHCSSFIGRWNIPLKHACTIGELANYFAATRISELELHVIRIPDFYRKYANLDDHFFPTSPAMHKLESAMLYPGLGLLEGVNINEGRGTPFPFTRFGAPWLDPEGVLSLVPNDALKGTEINTTFYQAATPPFKEEICKAIQIFVKNPEILMSVKLGTSLLRAIYIHHGDQLTERKYITHANPSGEGHLDRLLGIKNAFMHMINGIEDGEFSSSNWIEIMKPYQLYS